MTLKKRLAKYGITLDKLVDTALGMYIYDPRIGGRGKVRGLLRKGLEKALGDINVASLVLAGILLEEELAKGALKGLGKARYASDPVDLIADEMLGIQIANYIAGSRSLFEFERFDKKKPGILKALPPILDDVIAGLTSGVLVRACS